MITDLLAISELVFTFSQGIKHCRPSSILSKVSKHRVTDWQSGWVGKSLSMGRLCNHSFKGKFGQSNLERGPY